MRCSSTLLASTAVCATAVSAQTTSCADYVLISTRGTGELQGPSVGFVDAIKQTFAAVPNGITYNTNYPAAFNQTAYLGGDDIVRYINAGVAACPNQKYALLGYSQGASATALGLANFTASSPAYSLIKAVVVIGNPVRIAGRPANVDETGGASNRNNPGRSLAARPNAVTILQPYYDDSKLLDVCYSGDPVCDATANQSDIIPHLRYVEQEVQKLQSAFLISKLGGGSTPTYPAGNSTSPASPSGTGAVKPTGSGGVGPATTVVPSPGLGSSTGPNIVGAMVAAVVAGGLAVCLSL